MVTEAVLKIKPLPECKRYGSILFPDLESGVKVMELVGKSGIWPASMRLMDNTQFKFGQSLKGEENSKIKHLIEKFKKFYVLKIKGFDENKMTAMTLLFEGSNEIVKF